MLDRGEGRLEGAASPSLIPVLLPAPRLCKRNETLNSRQVIVHFKEQCILKTMDFVILSFAFGFSEKQKGNCCQFLKGEERNKYYGVHTCVRNGQE